MSTTQPTESPDRLSVTGIMAALIRIAAERGLPEPTSMRATGDGIASGIASLDLASDADLMTWYEVLPHKCFWGTDFHQYDDGSTILGGSCLVGGWSVHLHSYQQQTASPVVPAELASVA